MWSARVPGIGLGSLPLSLSSLASREAVTSRSSPQWVMLDLSPRPSVPRGGTASQRNSCPDRDAEAAGERGALASAGRRLWWAVLLESLGSCHTFETVRKMPAWLWHRLEGWLFQHVVREVSKHGPEGFWKTVFPAGHGRGRFESRCVWEDHHRGSQGVSPGTSLGLRGLLAADDLGAESQR